MVDSLIPKKFLVVCWLLLAFATPSALAQKDTDGDGLLDVLDATGFDAGSGELWFNGIEDLDGVNRLTKAKSLVFYDNFISSIESGDFAGLTNLQSLYLDANGIRSIENGDFAGLTNLQTLGFSCNGITSIETGDFAGLTNLQHLDLHKNGITSIESGAFARLTSLQILELRHNGLAELNFAGATFERLGSVSDCQIAFCFLSIDSNEITSLILDDATLSVGSFDEIISETTSITNASLVGLTFLDEDPTDLSSLFDITTLDNIWVDQALFDEYADEFNSFDAVDGNTVTVVPPGDCNKDGSLSDSDLACVFTIRSRDAVLAALNTLPGDLDGDGEVAFVDFLKLAENFGKPSASYVEGNIDLKDGVAFADFLELANNFGKTPSDVAAVPEPSGMALFSLGLLCCMLFGGERTQARMTETKKRF